MYRIGNGYDVHKFENNRKLILGGVEIPYIKGLVGHSDADVLVHSIIDSLLGALSLGDIGKYFPDNDQKYKDISSLSLLKKIKDLISSKEYNVVNIDSIIVMEKPKIRTYIEKMQENISDILKIEKNNISIKATTEEKLGFTGNELGVKAYTVSLLMNNKKML